jgi:sugar lactone lactonase YvrE
MRRSLVVALAVVAAAASSATISAVETSFPRTISLPNGWRPEGIAVGRGSTFYAGSLATGAVLAGDLRSGSGSVLVPPHDGRVAVGVDVDENGRIFVAGGPTGAGYVYAPDGSDLASYAFTSGPTFVNDVVVTRQAVWFTDSQQSVLYRVDLSDPNRLPAGATALPLTGDLVSAAGFNLNGIDATPNGKTLIVVQSNTGKLFTVDPDTGVTHEIDLGGSGVPNGDGILLRGRTLYVVQNQLNVIAVIGLSADLRSGAIERTVTDAGFDIPTTIDRFGDTLYAVNARFTTPPTPDTPYTIVAVPAG